MNSDEEIRELARLREKGLRDYKAGLVDAELTGIEKGIEKIAKAMKKKGFSIDEIYEITGLSKNEIEKL